MINEAVDSVQGSGPSAPRGVGESGTFGVSPAIANAIEDAVRGAAHVAAAHA